MIQDPSHLPKGLPIPIDDGRCSHLRGMRLPEISLPSTGGGRVTITKLLSNAPDSPSSLVLFFYPRSGVPNERPQVGKGGVTWESVPGARGCTPQACGFRDAAHGFREEGTLVLGVSTNTTAHQREFAERMALGFDLLSDENLELITALSLPTFEFPVAHGGPCTLAARMAVCVSLDSQNVPRIVAVWYPVFPPDEHATAVLSWLRARNSVRIAPATAADAPYIQSELEKHWLTTIIRSRDVPFDAASLPAFVARRGSTPVGLITLDHRGDECEIITVSSTQTALPDQSALAGTAGIGSALMDAAEDYARAHEVGRCQRMLLTTTNDNLRALRFYQRRGYRITAIYPEMLSRYRLTQPSIPYLGLNGIPLRDELELQWQLPA